MMSSKPEALIWRKKWNRKNWAIAAFAFTILIFVSTLVFDSNPENATFIDANPVSDFVDLTLSRSAKAKGAYCLDGSLPGYHLSQGFGSGVNNWLLHIEGGGWCSSIASCSFRKATALGSSVYMEQQVLFSGILSKDKIKNPDFHNWNKVKIRYCDGASFSGHPESELKNGTKLYFRGQLIWEAIMEDLLSLGLSTVKQALLTGCSAGGLATLIHCDGFRGILPKDASVKCLSDAGFFLDGKDISGHRTMQSFYHDVVTLQGVAKSLQEECITGMEPSKCLFPREIVKRVKSPVFLLNPAYDFWQIQNILVPTASDPNGDWFQCRLNILKCDTNQTKILHGFRSFMLNELKQFEQNKEGALFINSCFVHCQTLMTETWHSPSSPRINNKTIAEAVGDWYFNSEVTKLIDCPFPCNPTCYNLDFTIG